MMQTTQLGGVAEQQAPSILMGVASHNLPRYSGLIGNPRAQLPDLTTVPEFADVWTLGFLSKAFVYVHPTARLAVLKRGKFTAEGRTQRIKLSLDALNALQPTILTLEQWKEVIAEAEEDDED